EDFELTLSKTEEKQSEAVKSDTGSQPITMEQMKDISEAGIDDTSQKIVINTGNRYNNILRGLFFILSFVIVGYLLYRTSKKR
ncbi:MAG: hypothetical protein V1647_00390, partial [Pseudomonadota bacterium]